MGNILVLSILPELAPYVGIGYLFYGISVLFILTLIFLIFSIKNVTQDFDNGKSKSASKKQKQSIIQLLTIIVNELKSNANYSVAIITTVAAKAVAICV